MVNHYLAMFCGNWSSAGGDMKYSDCHSASHNHVIERKMKLLIVCHHSANFGGHLYCSSIDMFLVCHVF